MEGNRPTYYSIAHNQYRYENRICQINLYENRHIGYLAEAGCDIKILQYIIGHSDIRTTMRVYNHVDEGRVKREMDKLEEICV